MENTMKLARRHTLQLLAASIALGGAGLPAFAHGDDDDQDDDDGLRSGKVFTSSNAAAGNELLVYGRTADGSLQLVARAATQGLGAGAALGSQGAVALAGDARHVFVVNAASNTVSTFAVRRKALRLASVIDSGGLHPISVTEHDGIVYVLNDQGAGNVAGFRNHGGQLQPIAGSVRGLSAQGGTAPAQVGFSADGQAIVVSEKGTSLLTSYRVHADGGLGAAIETASAGPTPFGFAFNRRNQLLVSEAATSALSSYRFADAAPARPVLVSGSVLSGQAAACWVAVTPNGDLAYTVNAGSSSVSSYRVAGSGSVTLAHAVAGSTSNAGGTDAAVSADGRRLYVLATRGGAIVSFDISADGSLAAAGNASGVPAGSVGLAAN
jgi:6-phosphogluconolactonase